MSYRKTILANDEVYHIFNRGVAKQPIFTTSQDYLRATNLLDYYRFSKPQFCFSHFSRLPQTKKELIWEKLQTNDKTLVDIISYCFMPNHFHLLLKQLTENGISLFMANFQNAYARFFNSKNHRVGPLFQSVFKAVRIEDNNQLLHVNRYMHLNPVSSYLVEKEELPVYPWSSYPQYIGKTSKSFVKSDLVLDQFRNIEAYKKFVLDQADYQRQLASIKHLVLEENP